MNLTGNHDGMTRASECLKTMGNVMPQRLQEYEKVGKRVWLTVRNGIAGDGIVPALSLGLLSASTSPPSRVRCPGYISSIEGEKTVLADTYTRATSSEALHLRPAISALATQVQGRGARHDVHELPN